MDKAGQTEGHIKITMPDGEEVIWTSVETTALETYDGPYNITENGVLATSDKKLTANIVVDVPAPEPTLIEKNIAANGTYAAASDNADGYSEVNVNVPIPQPTLVTKSITANGTYNASSDNADGYSSVTVNVAGDDDPIKETLDAMIPAWNNVFATYEVNSMFYTKIISNMTRVKLGWFARSNEVTSTVAMFSNCSKLTSIPLFDTSNVTNMNSMFYKCSSLTSIPLFNTSNVTNMNSMLRYCEKLKNVPLFDTSKVTKMGTMFADCKVITTVPLLDTSNVTDMSSMFNTCPKLTSVPLFDTRKVTTMSAMFMACSAIKNIPAFDASNVTDMYYIFRNCSNLEEIHMTGMKVAFDISYSTKFTREALVEILNNLATVDTTRTLTMGSTNLAKLTEEDKAIATNKGWTLA